ATPNTSTLKNPTVVYNNPGTFPATLTATNSAGNNSTTISAYITVTQPVVAPVAAFGASIVEGNFPLSVTFFDESANEPTSWSWSFPSATPSSSNEKNPTVVYENVGCHDVSLTVTNSGGGNTHTKPTFICIYDVGIEDNSSPLLFLTLSPNPNNGTFQLSAELETFQPLQIRISDVLGREIYTQTIETKHLEETIDLPNIASGMYFLSVKAEKILQTLPFVVK
ncbi:MAG: PKD domain-containing protein, partial [Chitinophagales bacterium]